jgi:hypothetical protein
MTTPCAETAEPTVIVASRVSELRDKIAKANKRLAKAGIAQQFTLNVGEPYEVSYTTDSGFTMSDRKVEVSLNTPTLGYNGWTFVATLAFEEAGTVVRTVPGQTCSYRPSTKVCDQCGTARYRTETFVVRNDETGEYKQVGRNCLALFFGLTPALWIFSYDPINDLANEDSEGGSSAGYRDNRVLTEDIVLAAMAASDEGRGYKPASFEGETTKGQTQDVLFANYATVRSDYDRQFNAWLDETRATVVTMREAGLGAQVLDLVRNLKGSSEYAENARILANSEYVDIKNLGLVASFAKLWANEQSYAAERKAKAEANADKINEFFGEKGQKLVVEGTVTMIRLIEGQWGNSRLVVVLSDQGYTFKSFSTSAFVWDLEEGDKVTIAGTVKDFDTYGDSKSTVLTRIKSV